MNLGQRLYNYRKLKGLSQEEVAEKLNVTRQTISKWETGQSTPDFDKLTPICNLYNVSYKELITGEVEEKESIIEDNNNSDVTIKKKAKGIAISVFILFVAVAWLMVSIPVLKLDVLLCFALFLLIISVATGFIIYTCIVYRKQKKEQLTKKQRLMRQVNEILSIIFAIIYLIISFLTMAWNITWIIWIIFGLIVEIIKLIYMLKEEENEK